MLRRKTAAVKEAGLGEEEQAEQLLTEMTKNKNKNKTAMTISWGLE